MAAAPIPVLLVGSVTRMARHLETAMTDMRECSACGILSYSVHPKVVETDTALPLARYVVELRCIDTVACSERVEASSESGVTRS